MSIKEWMLEKRLLVCTVLTVMVTIVSGFMWAQKSVQVVADGQAVALTTLYSDPSKILGQAGFVLEKKDEYRLSTKMVENNTVITVYRALPVRVTYKGKQQDIITGKPTIGELMAEMGIDGDNVRVTPGWDTKITKNVEIKVVDVQEKIVERVEEAAFEVVRQPDVMMESGQEEVVSYGKTGEKTVKVKENFDDGVKVSEQILEERITTPAEPQVVKVGTRDTVDTSRGAMRFRRAAYMEASAYLPSDGNGNGITATGVAATRGVVAVDPDVIPLGSRLYVQGYGMAVAADTGGAIQGNTIDLCMESYSEAVQFGRRTVKVYILE